MDRGEESRCQIESSWDQRRSRMKTVTLRWPCAGLNIPVPNCTLRPYFRSEEADGRTPGSDRSKPLGGDPSGGLQARPRARGDQTAAEPRQTRHRAGGTSPSPFRPRGGERGLTPFLCTPTGPHRDVGGHVSDGHARPRPRDRHITQKTKEVSSEGNRLFIFIEKYQPYNMHF